MRSGSNQAYADRVANYYGISTTSIELRCMVCSARTTLVSDVTRECNRAVVDTSISGRRVVRELADLIAKRARPKMIVSDNVQIVLRASPSRPAILTGSVGQLRKANFRLGGSGTVGWTRSTKAQGCRPIQCFRP